MLARRIRYDKTRLIGLIDRWVVQTTLTGLGRGAIVLDPKRSMAATWSRWRAQRRANARRSTTAGGRR